MHEGSSDRPNAALPEGYSDRMLRTRVEDQSVKVHWVREGNRLIPLPRSVKVVISRDGANA